MCFFGGVGIYLVIPSVLESWLEAAYRGAGFFFAMDRCSFVKWILFDFDFQSARAFLC